MATSDLVDAFEVGRDQYLTDPVGYRGQLDRATNILHLQWVPAGSQTWVDFLTVGPDGTVTLSPSASLAALAGTKTYYVSDSSGGSPTRKLTFVNGLLVSET